MAEDWKLQVSYKTPSGDMINIRANTNDELSVLLEGIGDYSTQIAAVQRLVVGAYGVAPLATSTSTQNTAQSTFSAQPQTQAPFATAPTASQPVSQSSGPVCMHGPRKHKSGISSKTGNPYSMWVCPMPQGADQCKPVN
jgi:hypothetical protein